MNTNLNTEQSIYIQIARKIEDDILRDILAEGEAIPSTNQLAALYKINPATAAKGVNILVDEGILFKKRGIGMFVTEGGKRQIIVKRKEGFYEKYVVSLVREARQLNIDTEELVEMIKRVQHSGQ
ncbi:GntR family transcriptional regulator [Acetanaerobacterium elongatum]|uniref:DNA-binding transcriptional regulator YhcF, GntR family n=1 Tax=Acetanaerobacterium elongatum TaxID=258515 RepID=A0A1G9VB06_9FIRM|nr:GntR family transcriptional regulator [Acetanaerobacterium elongatum]SDM69236.1 DNA-binding transcriptional regulator YhcF, GntR family [Acetanaerobacterium elongatum]